MITPFEFIMNGIEMVILVWFICNYLTLKPTAKPWQILVLFGVLFTEKTLTHNTYPYNLALFAVVSITLFVFSFYCTTNHVLEKIMISICVMTIRSILNIFTMVFVASFFDQTITQVSLSAGPDKVMASIIGKFIFLCVVIIIVRLRRKIHATILSPKWWQFAVIACLGLFILLILMSFLYTSNITYPWLMVAILTVVAMIIFIFHLFVRVQIESQKSYENQMLLKELSMQKKSMEDIMAINKELRAYRHDVKHILDAAIGLVKSNQGTEALEMLVKYRKELDEIPEYITTGNRALDYILNSKISHGMYEGIRFKTMYAASSLTMEVDDVCILVGNALDNAIENCRGANKEVRIDFRNLNEYVVIKISNSIEESVLRTNPRLQSTKGDENSHGYGIRSMKYIANKYHGEINFHETDHEFHCQILLPA